MLQSNTARSRLIVFSLLRQRKSILSPTIQLEIFEVNRVNFRKIITTINLRKDLKQKELKIYGFNIQFK